MMTYTQTEWRTYPPFPKPYQQMMRSRAYSVDVTFPDGSLHHYQSMGHFAQHFGKRLEHIRSRAIYMEMQVGEVTTATWHDADDQIYLFVFTRKR